MKKILFLFLFAVTPLLAKAQFELTYHGFKNSVDASNFFEVSTPNASQEEIYNQVLTYFISRKKIGDEIQEYKNKDWITYSTESPQQIKRGLGDSYTLAYEITVQIEDGKVKIVSPIIECYAYGAANNILYRLFVSPEVARGSEGSSSYLFKKDDEPSKKNMVADIEQIINTEVQKLADVLTNK